MGEPTVSLLMWQKTRDTARDQNPGAGWSLLPASEPETGHKRREQARYRKASESEVIQEGQLAVLAEHSTEGWGRLWPRR
ncbi:hypothetical protein M1O54_07395 [Dehalococcoidia bacterium]|nr:hypothetical protein [Dehalococcoidia bacterium]